VARVKSIDVHDQELVNVRGFIVKEKYPEPLLIEPFSYQEREKMYVCHCDDVSLDEILETIGDRKFISVDEVKHTTRLGMGACRGKRCIRRLKQTLTGYGITIVGEATPRGPLSNQLTMGELYPSSAHEQVFINSKGSNPKRIDVQSLVCGGGIAGSALFRYLAEAGFKPVLVNSDRGSSWRNIAGGRPAFSLPEIADIARHNLEIFKELQEQSNINFRQINYVNFAHDEQVMQALENSRAWSDAYMISPKEFSKHISSYVNPNLKTYLGALITKDCWQATPGLVLDHIRRIGIDNGGIVKEDCRVIDLRKEGNKYIVLVRDHDQEYIEYHTDIFINALGGEAGRFASKLGLETGLYPVKHQAFITRRLPMMGINGNPLDMIIDRRKYKGFVAVYGQQLAETGQVIGCASPAVDPLETDKNLKINSKQFLEIVSEVFVDWFPNLSSVGFQAVWAGYYVEPRMIVDPENGLLVGLRGQGYMLGQYLAKLYVDKLMGKQVPEYMERLKLSGDGLPEKAFK